MEATNKKIKLIADNVLDTICPWSRHDTEITQCYEDLQLFRIKNGEDSIGKIYISEDGTISGEPNILSGAQSFATNTINQAVAILAKIHYHL